MDLIDRLHRVPLVRKALGLRGRMNLVAPAMRGNRPVAGRSVMDEDGSRRNVPGIGHQRLLRGRLPHPAEEDDASFAIGRRADAELVPGKPAHRVAVCVPGLRGLPDRDVLLIDPHPTPEDDALLYAINGQKQLGHAVKPGGIRVHVRFRRRGRAVELEKVVQELYGLGNRYLLRIEHRSGQGAEFPLAVWVQAFVYPDPGLLAEPVLSDAGGSAVRAGFGDDGVDEGDLGLAPRPVLFVEPFGDGLFGEGSQLP